MINNTQNNRFSLLGNCSICSFFITLAALAIYVMVAMPQSAGI